MKREPPPVPQSARVALHSARLLDSLRREPSATFALVGEGSGEVVALVQGDRGCMAAPQPEADLGRVLAQQALWAVRRPVRVLPQEGSFPMAPVRWNFGVRYGLSHGLGPWLDPEARFQMLDWPDFRLLGDFDLALQVCRQLSGPPQSLQDLLQATGEAAPALHAALNAVSLCGRLRQEPGGRRKY